MHRHQSFLPILGTLILAVGSAAYAQQSAPKKQVTGTRKAEPVNRLRNAPPVPTQQHAFCAAYYEDEKRHKDFEEEIAATGENPIALKNAKRKQPEFAKLFHARQFELMGDGSFQNWTGLVHIELARGSSYASPDPIDIAFIQVTFPCIWMDYSYERSPEDRDYSKGWYNRSDKKFDTYDPHDRQLTIGNGFNIPNGFRSAIEIPASSVFGQGLGTLAQDEPVAVSGKLFCTKEKGCQQSYLYEGAAIHAEITSVRSLKTGKVFKEPKPDVQTLSRKTPYISVGGENCVDYNASRRETLQAMIGKLEANLNTFVLPAGSRYAAVMNEAGAPVTIQSRKQRYSLIKQMNDLGMLSGCELIPDGDPVQPSPETLAAELTAEHTLKLTPAAPEAERTATIVAPPEDLKKFNVYYIDASAFTNGGALDIELTVAANSGTNGRFILFPPNASIPTKGRLMGIFGDSYDVLPGTSTHMPFKFSAGRVIALGLSGSWFNTAGAKGSVTFRARVSPTW